MYRVGVFDSGVGGQSVAKAIQLAIPTAQVTFVNDSKNVPYGTKTPDQLLSLVLPILQNLARSADVIVIACNTVSTTLLDQLRESIDIPLIGVEPMVEVAANMTKSGVVAVCATPTTLHSQRYNELKRNHASNVTVLEPDCSDWAYLIETDQVDRHNVYTLIDEACNSKADIIVLGCTHYHWIEDIITETADGRAQIVQPESAIVDEVKRVLARLA